LYHLKNKLVQRLYCDRDWKKTVWELGRNEPVAGFGTATGIMKLNEKYRYVDSASGNV
jgi:hypothetical protein